MRITEPNQFKLGRYTEIDGEDGSIINEWEVIEFSPWNYTFKCLREGTLHEIRTSALQEYIDDSQFSYFIETSDMVKHTLLDEELFII